MSIGISGKILDCIKSIYEDGKAGLNVNGHITDWIFIDFGVKQGTPYHQHCLDFYQ